MITSKDRKEAEDFCNASEEYLSLSEYAKQEAFIELRQLQNRVREAVKVLDDGNNQVWSDFIKANDTETQLELAAKALNAALKILKGQ